MTRCFFSHFSTPTPGWTLGDQDDILSWTLNSHSSDWTFLMNTANTLKQEKQSQTSTTSPCPVEMSRKKTAYPCLSTATLSNRTLSFWSIAAVCHQPGIRQLSSNHLKKVSETYMSCRILKHGYINLSIPLQGDITSWSKIQLCHTSGRWLFRFLSGWFWRWSSMYPMSDFHREMTTKSRGSPALSKWLLTSICCLMVQKSS